MGEKSEVFSEKIRNVGLLDFGEFYNFLFNWLKDEGYNISEDQYVEKVKSAGKDLEIAWTAKKKVTDYFRNIVTVKFRIFRLEDAEAEQNGKKIKVNKGDVSVTIKASVERDYEGKWEEKPSYKFFRGIYDKYIIRTTIDEYEDRLQDDMEEYTEQAKAFLNLEGKK